MPIPFDLVSDKGRKRWPFALLAIVCAAAVIGVLTGATGPLSATQFANTGHWVYNSVLGTVFHIDGATTNIDAQLPMDADPRSQVLQSDTSGYVVGSTRITAFDKASQSTREPVRPPTKEVPLGLEVVGGPYAVYRNAGTIVRLGDPPATIPAGGAIGDPVVTDDGTMWFHRTGKGSICRLGKDAVTVSSCPVSAPKDHPGALTIVDGRPAFVDLFTGRLHTVAGDGLGAGVPLGVRLSPNSKPAAQDTDGRLAILDPGRSNLVLVDTRTRPATVVTKALPRGDYAGPVSTGEVIALVDRQKDVVLTFGADGASKDTKPIEQKAGEPRLSSGEDDRIYVEDADGTEVLVVDEDGSVRDVDVTAQPAETPTPTQAPEDTPADTGQPAGPPTDTGEPTGPPTGAPEPGRDTPPPLPPSRPGAPLAVAAVPGNGAATVTWNAAPDNRAPVTAYQVAWQTGSVTLGPDARQVVADGLTNGVTYTFTVTATNQVGTGPGASSPPVTPAAPVVQPPPPPPPPPQAVSISRGAPSETDNCHPPSCAWVNATMSGFALNTTYPIRLSSTANENVRTESFTTDATGAGTYNELNYDVPGETVWVSVQTPEGWVASNRISWDGPAPRATVTRGEPTDKFCGDLPGCAWMHVELTGFAAETAYHIQPFTNGNDDYYNEGHTTTTDESGFAVIDEFAFAGTGDSVWVVVTLDSDRGTVVAQSEPYVW
jgi:hypothetical protein